MSTNKSKKPELRFKGFSDDWEQRKFSDITFPAGEKNRDNLPYESYSITNEDGFVPQDEKFENGGTMRDADKRMYIIVSPHSFAYNPARINVGSIGYQNTSKSVIVSSLYEVFKTTNDVNDRFLWHWFKSSDFQKMILRLQEGGVRLYFYYDKLCMGSIAMPSLHEQSLIGQYFDNLDCLITLHQSKCDKLKIIKKLMLNNLFPKNGEKNPKWRFNGFNDDWEQCKLGDVVGNTFGGGTPATTNEEFWKGDIPWIQSSNAIEGELFDIDVKKHISRDGLTHSAAQLIPENSVAVVTHVGVGKLVFMPYSYATSQDFISLSDLKCNPKFLCYAVYKKLKEDLHIVQGSAIKGITKEDLMSKQLLLPSVDEQRKIADTLLNLDHLITLHQSEVERLKKVKQFFLDKMFI